MNMKLLLFILGLTLCASWPAFSRNLAGSSEENNEENSFLDFLDGELGEYDTFADADHDNSFDLFDLNFHLNEEGEVETSLGEENNEEALPEDPSDEPTEETPEEPTEETPEEPTEETPEEPTEETPEEPAEETPEEPTEETPEEPTEETPEEPTEETPEEPTEETPEENTEAVVETPEENTEYTTQEEEENNEPEDLLTQVRADAEANDVLNFGVSTIIAQGINKTKIPNDNYTVTSISNYNKTGSAKGNLYQISCVAANANGSSVLSINFTVFYQFSNQRKTLSSWSYNIKTSTPVTPTTEFAQIGQDEINTDTVQKVLNYGVAQIYAIGTQAGKISGSALTVNNVVSVWKQATTNGFNYKFQAVLVNDKVTVNANFTVALKSSNQETKLIQWSYNVKNGTPNTNNNTTTPTNNTTPSNNTTNTNTTNPNNNTGTNNDGGNASNNTTQPTNNTNNNNNGNNNTNNNTTSNNTTQPATNNTTPANNTNNDGFVELETAEIETSGEVQGALDYGTDWIIKSGNAKGKIPVSNYTITKVNSVERKTQSNGRNAYRCDVELQDAKKVITAQFTVYVKVSTQEFSMGSWTYNISNIKTNNSNGSTNTNTNNNTNTTTNNNNNNTTTQPTTNTTTPANTTNSTATNFTALTQDEINSAEVQGALNFGANRVIQIGYEKGQIPVSNYTITKVNSVGKQVASNGRNAYKCDVELQDVNKVLVKAQFVVYVKVATQERSVGAWSYQVSNKGNAPKPSTNTKTL